MPTELTALLAEDIRVSTGDVDVVRGCTVRVLAGATTAIVGESGSGKSLTARAIVGLLPPGLRATGSLTVDARRVDLDAQGPQTGDAWRKLRGSTISLLLQDPFTSLSPVHRIGAQISQALKISGTPAGADVVTRRLAEVGLPDRVLRQYPHELSGGMRQRVALVLALASDPAVLIADEPTTALDSLTQAEILGLIDELKVSRGMGVLLISHDLDVVAGHAERVEVMCAGTIVERGSARTVLRHAVHPYTRGLLAAAPRGGKTEAARAPWLLHPGAELPAGAQWGAYADASELRLGAVPVLVPVASDTVTDAEHEVAIFDGRADEVVRVREQPEAATVNTGERPGQHAVSSEPLLTVTGLSYRRGERDVLSGIDLTVRRGEILGLVGQSGSGKTTLARCIAGLERASEGTISMHRDGADISRAGHVHMVFQDPAGTLNPALTVRRTLTESIRSSRSRRQTPEGLLELVGLPSSLLSRRPAALSGGQRQRVAIARALASEPELLVCDEAVSALDVSVQAQILDLLTRLRDEHGQTMLFISHDLAVVGQICDRIAVLNEGVIVETGPTDAVLDAPTDAYTRLLLGASRGTAEPT